MPTVSMRHSLIPACDVDLPTFRKLLRETAGLSGISAYKVGFRLGLEVGLPEVVRIVRGESNKPVIYDHQKAATDIPDTADHFTELCSKAGIQTIILFPLTGPVVLEHWVRSCQKQGVGVMVGGIMTHTGFLESEQGFICADAPARIYAQAADLGVREFVVPATRMDTSWGIFELLKRRNIDPIFYSPGVGAQGGTFQDLCRPSGPAWHAIVGRALLEKGEIRKNAEMLLAQSGI